MCPTLFQIVSVHNYIKRKCQNNSASDKFFGKDCLIGYVKKSYLGPRSSAEHSLRFRDSALAGSDEFSPTPLILNAYQRLES